MSDFIFTEVDVQKLYLINAYRVLLKTSCYHCGITIETQSLELTDQIYNNPKDKEEFYKSFNFMPRFLHSQECKIKLKEKMGDLCGT